MRMTIPDEFYKEPDIPILYYGGYQGLPLGLFPKGIPNDEVFGSFRHVKVKKIKIEGERE